VKEQWVYVSVERESGNIFLIPIPDRMADTLIAVISAWIKHVITVISDGWTVYFDLDVH
jgi:hypothetical protein